jgi:uncharacterized protein YqeY
MIAEMRWSGGIGPRTVRRVSETLRERLKSALPTAMKQRDAVLLPALRSTLAALDNAEAVPATDPGPVALEHTPVGVGVREAERRQLSEEDVRRLVLAEIAERESAARDLERAGHSAPAETLRAEAAALTAITREVTGGPA